MQIHNVLSPAQRTKAVDTLEAVAKHLAQCRPSAHSSEDELLFTSENSEDGVKTLHLRLGNREMRVFVAVRRDGRVQRSSFVECLREDHPANPSTMIQAIARLSEWRRYIHQPTDDELRDVEEKLSIAVKAAVGAVSMWDERWKTLWIHPAFDTKPPLILLSEPSGRTSAFRTYGIEGETSGRMSDELVRDLSIIADRMFVTATKAISNPGIQIEFGPLPGVRVINDFSSMDLLNSMRRAETLGLRMLP